MKVGLFEYWSAIASQLKPWQFWDFLLTQPLVGLSLYWVKPWSYPLFLLGSAWNLYKLLEAHQMFPGTFSLAMLVGFYVLNIGVVSYFMIPQVRVLFFNRRLRWWEQKPRYFFEIDAALLSGARAFSGKILNFSEGGVFFRSDAKLDVEKKVYVQFDILGNNYSLPAQIVHKQVIGSPGFGVQFVDCSKAEKTAIKTLVRNFVKMGLENRNSRDSLMKDLVRWGTELVTTGRGLIPEHGDSKKNKKVA